MNIQRRKIIQSVLAVVLIPYVYLNLHVIIRATHSASQDQELLQTRFLAPKYLSGQLNSNITIDFQNLSPESKRILFLNEIQKRRERVQEVCDLHSDDLRWVTTANTPRIPAKKLLWDVKHKLGYCAIAKVASATWFNNFLQLAYNDNGGDNLPNTKEDDDDESSEDDEGRLRMLIKKHYPVPKVEGGQVEMLEMWNSMDGFMVVRHPFVRLVSAYEDKMLNPDTATYFQDIQEEIKSLRKNKRFRLKFPESLLSQQLYEKKLNKGRFTMKQLESQPSFPEFVKWLIRFSEEKGTSISTWSKEKGFSPFYTICPVCNMKFIILKLDSELKMNEMDEFIKYKKLNISLSDNTIHDRGGKRSSVQSAEEYYQTITKAQVEKLSEIYKLDFQLFGYDYQHYYDLAKDE